MIKAIIQTEEKERGEVSEHRRRRRDEEEKLTPRSIRLALFLPSFSLLRARAPAPLQRSVTPIASHRGSRMLCGSARVHVTRNTMPSATARAHQAARAAAPLTTSSSPSSTQPRPLLVVGSINQDVVLKVSRLPCPGETLAASSMELFPGGKVRRGFLSFALLCFFLSVVFSFLFFPPPLTTKNKNPLSLSTRAATRLRPPPAWATRRR